MENIERKNKRCLAAEADVNDEKKIHEEPTSPKNKRQRIHIPASIQECEWNEWDTAPPVMISAQESIVQARLDDLDEIENENLRRFIESHMPLFQLERVYSQEKVRSVCQSTDSENASGSDSQAEKERKAKYRRENNERSQISRLKQKDARTRKTLTLIFLQSQLAEYGRRIEKLIDIFNCMQKKVRSDSPSD